jgi:hypothetical protein
MNRADIANRLHNPHVDSHTMYQIVQEYYKRVFNEEWKPERVDIRWLEQEYNEALTCLAKLEGVHILYDKTNKFIKSF